MNNGVDALSTSYLLLYTLETKVLGFDYVKELSAKDEDFKEILEKCSKHAHDLFHLENGFLFKRAQLCILKSGFRELLIEELHRGALARDFGVEKTWLMLKISLLLAEDDQGCGAFCQKVFHCQFTNSSLWSQRLYSSLFVPQALWEDVSLDFITCLRCKGKRIPSWQWWIGSKKWLTL